MRKVENITLSEFFEKLSNYMDDGDKLYVKYDTDENGNDDYDNKIYSVYNSCDNVIWEYFEKSSNLCTYQVKIRAKVKSFNSSK